MADETKAESSTTTEARQPQEPDQGTEAATDETQITHPLQETKAKAGMESEEHFMDAAEQQTPAATETSTPQHNESPSPVANVSDTTAPRLTRQATEAIGPDLPTPILENQTPVGVHIQFILLLASAGTRHPFQLNEKYLKARNVTAANSDGHFDPSAISVYNLKELIFRDWRDDWEAKPSSPSAIRLIFFGQLLADNTNLKECRIVPNDTPHVLHISVKPQEAMDDEEAGKTGKASIRRGRDGGSSGGCSCVIL